MNVLGISGRERHAAAAVSIDGALAAAAAEESFARVRHIGYRHTGGYPLSAIAACLTRASLTCSEIDRVIVVDDERPREDDPRHDSPAEDGRLFAGAADEALERELRARPHESVVAALADARQLTAVCEDEDLLVVVLGRGSRRIGDLRTTRGATDATAWCAPAVLRDQANGRCARPGRVCAIRHDRTSGRLVLRPALAVVRTRHYVGAGSWLRAERRGSRTCDCAAARARGSIRVGRLAQHATAAGPPGARRHFLRARDRGRDRHGRPDGGARGTWARRLHGQPALEPRTRDRPCRGRSATRRSLPRCPRPDGRAIGAALDGDVAPAAHLRSLALGPDFSEQDIKLALENCRLDYLYEPDWSRLLARISRMLSQGSVVGWFQGPMGFGPRPADTRGILCDPANRYARENINRFLRHASIDDPLPVSMTATCDARLPRGAGGLTLCDAGRPRQGRVARSAARVA